MPDQTPHSPATPGTDPSMDEILASIRRILNEDDVHPTQSSPPDDALLLDGSMLVNAPLPVAEAQTPSPQQAHSTADTTLVAPEAAAAASTSVNELMRALADSRQTAVYRQGPTIEDLVREEMRPVLKAWLDTHLPPLVERLVRTEIERVVSRMHG